MSRSKMGVRTDRAGIEKRTMDGVTFGSEKECVRYAELKMLERGGVIRDLKLKTKYPLLVNSIKICDYEDDFSYWDITGKIVEDVKGRRAGCAYEKFRIKAKLMRAINGITVREI